MIVELNKKNMNPFELKWIKETNLCPRFFLRGIRLRIAFHPRAKTLRDRETNPQRKFLHIFGKYSIIQFNKRWFRSNSYVIRQHGIRTKKNYLKNSILMSVLWINSTGLILNFTRKSTLPGSIREDQYSETRTKPMFKLADINGTVLAGQLAHSVTLTFGIPFTDIFTSVTITEGSIDLALCFGSHFERSSREHCSMWTKSK